MRRVMLAVAGTMVGIGLLVVVKEPFVSGHSTAADGPLDPAGSGDGGGCDGASPSPSPAVRPTVTRSAPSRAATGAAARPKASAGRSPAGLPPQRDQPVTVDGPEVEHRFGPVQVRIVVRGDRILDIVALELPSGRAQAYEINGRAEPKLRAEALRTQSARIHSVSGATLTSEAYSESLQGAIDNAGLDSSCQ